ncbi:hypothetical protein FD755_023426 [Muntiacus reevesi]|uniref:Solute carrier family 25 member 3 n=1 Tax=Muntiacus reevesi TaxID=9886 RepID=A0A5N3VXU1_MUNRE|nr:hypothetical protein FD755_023426 [Muntiacus reevesi]
MDVGILKRCQSPWNTPLLLVKKPGGTDYLREVNKRVSDIHPTVSNPYALLSKHSCEYGFAKFYALCGFGGVLSCGLTYTAVVPLDLKYKGIFNGFSVTLKEDGFHGLDKGWAPILIGYSLQGLCKFGFYEVFKVLYSNILGEENA